MYCVNDMSKIQSTTPPYNILCAQPLYYLEVWVLLGYFSFSIFVGHKGG